MVNASHYQYLWKYASVIGMLMYVARNSCPEIAFSVHQCAIFTHNFKHSHYKSVLGIFKYLQGTLKDG